MSAPLYRPVTVSRSLTAPLRNITIPQTNKGFSTDPKAGSIETRYCQLSESATHSVSTMTQPCGSHAHAPKEVMVLCMAPAISTVFINSTYPSRSHQILSGNFPPLPIKWDERQTQAVDSNRDFSPCANSHCRLCRTSSRSYGDLFRIINCYTIQMADSYTQVAP